MTEKPAKPETEAERLYEAVTSKYPTTWAALYRADQDDDRQEKVRGLARLMCAAPRLVGRS